MIYVAVFAAALGGAALGTFVGFYFATTMMISAVKKGFGDESD